MQLLEHGVKLVYEDNHLLVVIKPPGMPVMADASGDGDLLNCLKNYLKIKYQKPGAVYLGLIHRLDRGVGGLLVFAKTSKAASRLSEQMRNRQIGKIYQAYVRAVPNFKVKRLRHWFLVFSQKSGNVNSKVLASVQSEQESAPVWQGIKAKLADLEVRVLQQYQDYCQVEIDLHSGLKHQIRAQLAAEKMPIIGDFRYDSQGATRLGAGIIALQACQLQFKHPVKDREMKFCCNMPTLQELQDSGRS